MKYLISYLCTAAVFLGVYYFLYVAAAVASFLTDGASNYLVLIGLAAISGLMGPICLYSKKLNKKS